MFRKNYWRVAIAALLANLPLAGAAQLGAHVHGIATLQIAVDATTLTLDFSSPLDNLIGFEHMPRNQQQQSTVSNMADRLKHADQLFVTPAEAQCTLQSAQLASPVLTSVPSASTDQHNDLDGTFIFTCKHPAQLHSLEVKLFDAFPHLHQLKVEVATLKKQAAATLTPAQRQIHW